MPKSLKIVIVMVVIIAIALAFAGGYFIGQANPSNIPSGMNIVQEAWNDILTKYVDPTQISSVNMTGAAISGIISSLHDRYTTYISAADFKDLQNRFQGELEGIGAIVTAVNDKITIVTPIAGAPAEKAGIKKNDVILAINGESTANMTVDVATSKVRGPAGTVVKLLVLHQGATQPVEITVTRAKVDVPSVAFEMHGDIARISISEFTARTDTELAQVLPKLVTDQATGIILDLRSNPGGLLDTVVDVASHFITQGTIVSVRSRQGTIETLKAVKEDTTTTLPMVVLVDEYSASGAEVLTGALQDYDRALVAGNVTYGKGSVDILQPLKDGSGIYITISRWLTPDGRLIEGNGITPDVKLDVTGDDELQWAIDYLHGVKSR
ncbi:MAG: S41 family peptidase [Dehalococcoidales bacterium]|jgi:carboxyl-terminal processing protease